MRLDEYQAECARTAVYVRTNVGGQRIAYCALALAGEVGELANIVKKSVRSEGFSDCFYSLSRERAGQEGNVSEKVRDELGDVFWYLAMLSRECGFTLEEVARFNLAKLAARHGGAAK